MVKDNLQIAYNNPNRIHSVLQSTKLEKIFVNTVLIISFLEGLILPNVVFKDFLITNSNISQDFVKFVYGNFSLRVIPSIEILLTSTLLLILSLNSFIVDNFKNMVNFYIFELIAIITSTGILSIIWGYYTCLSAIDQRTELINTTFVLLFSYTVIFTIFSLFASAELYSFYLDYQKLNKKDSNH